MTHLPLDGSLIGSHPLVSRFMKGVFQSRPPCPIYLATWDVSVVLSHLRSLSPKEDLSFKDVTFKLMMLMGLVCAIRADTLHKLDLQFRVFKHDGISFKIPQLTHRARETPYGSRNCLLRIPDIPIWCLCVVALNPGYPHMAFRILQQKTTICSLIG